MEDTKNDFELMQLISKGDERAFEKLFKSYYARLVVYARRYMFDVDMSENVVQAVFVKLWEKRESLNISAPFAYLLISVRNHCLNEIKQQKHLQPLSNELLFIKVDEETPANEELIVKVQKVISLLPLQRQKIFRMNRFEGLKYREIAQKLDLSVKTVEAQMGLALKFLREKLKDVYS